jgi:hypothetical protein
VANNPIRGRLNDVHRRRFALHLQAERLSNGQTWLSRERRVRRFRVGGEQNGAPASGHADPRHFIQ